MQREPSISWLVSENGSKPLLCCGTTSILGYKFLCTSMSWCIDLVWLRNLTAYIEVWSLCQQSKQYKTSIHRHQTPPRYRHVIHRRRCTVQPPPFVVAPITAKRDVIHKPDVHIVAQRRRRRIEPRPQGICTQYFVRIGPAVPEIYSRTGRHTDKRVNHNTPHPYRGGVTS